MVNPFVNVEREFLEGILCINLGLLKGEQKLVLGSPTVRPGDQGPEGPSALPRI